MEPKFYKIPIYEPRVRRASASRPWCGRGGRHRCPPPGPPRHGEAGRARAAASPARTAPPSPAPEAQGQRRRGRGRGHRQGRWWNALISSFIIPGVMNKITRMRILSRASMWICTNYTDTSLALVRYDAVFQHSLTVSHKYRSTLQRPSQTHSASLPAISPGRRTRRRPGRAAAGSGRGTLCQTGAGWLSARPTLATRGDWEMGTLAAPAGGGSPADPSVVRRPNGGSPEHIHLEQQVSGHRLFQPNSATCKQ